MNCEDISKVISAGVEVLKAFTDGSYERKLVKERKEIEKNIARHGDALYITLKNDPNNTWFCSACYGNNGKLIPVDKGNPGNIYCPVCKSSSWYDKDMSSESADQQDQNLIDFIGYNGYNR